MSKGSKKSNARYVLKLTHAANGTVTYLKRNNNPFGVPWTQTPDIWDAARTEYETSAQAVLNEIEEGADFPSHDAAVVRVRITAAKS